MGTWPATTESPAGTDIGRLGSQNMDDTANGAIEFGIVTGQHWRSWETILDQWRWAEATGWDSAWVFDHFFSLRPDDTGQTLDGWSLLAGLATQTQRLRIGALVTGVTHRHPSVLLKQAVTADHLSSGRLILGLGAAWNEREHEAYGLPFPAPGQRVDMLGETLELQQLFETQDRTTFNGDHYRIDDAPFEPKPVNGHMPVMIGTSGKRMLRHVARYADYWDSGRQPEDIPALAAQVDGHCEEFGRDPAEIRRAISAYCEPSSNPNAPIIDWTQSNAEVERDVRDHVARYAQAGVRMFLFNIPTDAPNAQLDYVAREVFPGLRREFSG